MKRRFSILLCVLIALATVLPVMASSDIPVLVDGQRVVFDGAQPVIVDERTLVPVRGVFEHMGFTVDWDEVTGTAFLTRPGDVVTIRSGDAFFVINGEPYSPVVAPQIINERFMLPIRAIAEATGADVDWIAETRTVVITTQLSPGQLPPSGDDNVPPGTDPPPAPGQPAVHTDPVNDSLAPDAPPAAAEQEPTFFSSSITIPNRQLTVAERQAWIDEYNTTGATAFELEVVRLTNIERTNRGLAPLELCHTLMLAARFHAQTMSNLNTTLSHTVGPYGGSFGVADAFGDQIVAARAANGLAGRWTPEAAVQSWMDSPDHRENILHPQLTRIGTGFYLGGQWGVFGYQLFGGGAATAVPN